MIPPCSKLSNIRYVSRIKWSNPRKGVAPFPIPQCSRYWKGSLLVTNFTLLTYIETQFYVWKKTKGSLILWLYYYFLENIHTVDPFVYDYWPWVGNVVVNVLDCDIIESKLELQPSYYVHFWTNTLGKGMHPLSPSPKL